MLVQIPVRPRYGSHQLDGKRLPTDNSHIAPVSFTDWHIMIKRYINI